MLIGVFAIWTIQAQRNQNLSLDFSQYRTPVPIPFGRSEPPSDFISSFSEFYPASTASVFWSSKIFNSTSFTNSSLRIFGVGLNESRNGAFLAERANLAQEILAKSSFWSNPSYGGYVDVSNFGSSPFEFWIYLNQTGVHCKRFEKSIKLIFLAMPTYINLLSNLVFKNATGSKGSAIVVELSPFPQTAPEKLRQQRLNSVWVCFMFLQALIFIPASYIVYIVVERESKAKHQQLISGVSISAYCNFQFFFFSNLLLRDKQLCFRLYLLPSSFSMFYDPF
jgi:hypothetical protein